MANKEQVAVSAEDAAMLEKLLAGDTEAWMAEPGETLIGTIVDLQDRTSKFGAYPAITVRKDDGEELTFHAFRSVAKSELAKVRPVVGDRIGILYIGPQPGIDYHLYKIRLDRVNSAAALDWDKYDTASPTPAAEETKDEVAA